MNQNLNLNQNKNLNQEPEPEPVEPEPEPEPDYIFTQGQEIFGPVSIKFGFSVDIGEKVILLQLVHPLPM